ncbi:MAG: beta-lactamase family protein, partial [Armatimonadetes bacterium]|nr:beta-lactamase family protein [Armatimonadota bacterium]
MENVEPISQAEQLRELVESAVRPYMGRSDTVGLAVGVICAGHPSTFLFGRISTACDQVPDERTIFEIGSITKVFTALLLAELALRGEMKLDDPIRILLPEGRSPPAPGGREITLRHLAIHTSGLPRLPGNMEGEGFDAQNPYAHYTADDLYEYLSGCRLKSFPGNEYEYSNLGAGLLGHLLERRTGREYDDLVNDLICRPLGMHDTKTLIEDQNVRLAPGHSGGEPVSNWDSPTLAGAGALRSSLADMMRFLAANLDPKSTPLGEAIEASHVSQFGDGKKLSRWNLGLLITSPLLWYSIKGLLNMIAQGQLWVWLRILLTLGLTWWIYARIEGMLHRRYTP